MQPFTGEISLYGGSHQTFTPSFDYGSSVGNTEYFVAVRANWNALDWKTRPGNMKRSTTTRNRENSSVLRQRCSTNRRGSAHTAEACSRYRDTRTTPIGLPLGDFGPTNFNSSSAQTEIDAGYLLYGQYRRAAEAYTATPILQIKILTRYAKVNFIPDVFGDLLFNDVASNVTRESLLNGSPIDTAYSVNDRHTLRVELPPVKSVPTLSTLRPYCSDPVTGAISPTPFNVTDRSSITGVNIGTYVQEGSKFANDLTLNVGLRFDQLYHYVIRTDSVRASHWFTSRSSAQAYTRAIPYFTPPFQAQAATANLALLAEQDKLSRSSACRSGETGTIELLR